LKPDVREQTAAFRYSLIAPIVSRQTPLATGELKPYLEEVSQRDYTIPGSQRTRISIRCLERWLAAYRRGGWEALFPKKRKDQRQRRLSEEIISQAIALRKEQPQRSVEQIIFLLEESGRVEKGDIAQSTLARHLKKAGVSQKELLGSSANGKYRRFQAEDVHVLWQSDFQHTLYLPHPTEAKRKKKALLFAVLDDYSRLLVHGEFYWDEKMPRLEDSLKKAILRHGIPEQLYVDNGAVFSSHHLQRICGRIGTRLSHSRPYRPQGRGKIERFFRTVDTSFVPEAYEAIEAGHIQTLTDLNRFFHDWVEGYYHLRKHGGTHEPPKERAQRTERQIRRIPEAELTEVFFWEEERKVDKTGCISLQGNSYEVDLELVGKKVNLRYDPFDLSVIQIWWQDQRWDNASPVDLTRSYDRRVTPTVSTDSDSNVLVESISFFELVAKKRKQELQKDPLRFAKKEGE
jgi:putative transposase